MFTARKNIFLIFTLSLTWSAWFLLAYLTRAGLLDFISPIGQLLFIIGGSAPTVGAYLAVVKTRASGDLAEFHSRVFKVRLGFRFYVYALFIPALIGIAGLGLVSVIADQSFWLFSLNNLFAYIPAFMISIVLGGIEELGWRGVLQHELKSKWSLFRLNLIIGIIWALWHFPLIYVAGAGQEGISFFFYTLSAIGYSGFLSWLYARTESVFLCVLFHASINATAIAGLSVPMDEASFYPVFAIIVLLSGMALTLKGPQR